MFPNDGASGKLRGLLAHGFMEVRVKFFFKAFNALNALLLKRLLKLLKDHRKPFRKRAICPGRHVLQRALQIVHGAQKIAGQGFPSILSGIQAFF